MTTTVSKFLTTAQIKAVVEAWLLEMHGKNVPLTELHAHLGMTSEQYESWRDHQLNFLPFATALEALLAGHRVARQSWLNRGMFAYKVNGSKFNVNRAPLLGIYPEGTEINYQPHLDMRMADGTVMTWTPNQAELFATDWVVVA